MKPHDLVRQIDLEKAGLTHFNLSPTNWRKCPSPPFPIVWNRIPFRPSAAARLPINDHGVYSFVIDPAVVQHPRNCFVAYVGKADRLTLKKRFESYFLEKRNVKRPAITYLLNKFYKHLEFCFMCVPTGGDIAAIEDSLISALDPPFNRAAPAEVSKIRRGLT